MQPYIRLADEQERDGRLDLALHTLRRALKDSAYGMMKEVVAANIERILRKCAMHARHTVWPIEALYENGNNPRTSDGGTVRLDAAPVVSLTTISSRIDRVAQTIDCIARQTLRPHSINLYISESPYLLDEGIERGNQHLQRIADLGANIYLTSNIGPYRKQYPLVQQLRLADASPETLIVTMDDDVLYPSDVLSQLTEAACSSDAVVAHRGREMAFDGRQLMPYSKFEAPALANSQRNLGTGKNGIAYRLKHFPTDSAAYVGPWLAPTADDIWCKWVTGVRSVPTIILEPRAIYDSRFDFSESKPADKIGLYHAFNAKGTNDDAMMNMEDFFLYQSGSNLSSIFGGLGE
jgi:hypothetical protein